VVFRYFSSSWFFMCGYTRITLNGATWQEEIQRKTNSGVYFLLDFKQDFFIILMPSIPLQLRSDILCYMLYALALTDLMMV